ncbi:benzoate 4-monooxygenase cytochrome P450 [Microsporum canis CBS 113480]|uniref:Benzoate 4-monooxygenase cytochrome P450 n=1 Tax=Arthroderma otae (strain ATCC MYA-4605 / CBS 113480) TaxID=554155 RepID=C5FLY0_ARTOC|nr:benzoate 4-monooxygenase cytochrome P450 [Microsporum canis CBS 113480]EEQ30702.1 benzoate 4-monooxygenase cytochrome P450 [Microsporum canis CBS 113480]
MVSSHSSLDLPRLLVLLALAWGFWIMITAVKRIFQSVRSPIPGPNLAKFSSLWIQYNILKDSGRVWETIHRLHQKYGPVVRVAPNSVSVCHPDALRTIYYGPRGLNGGILLSTLRQYNSDNLVSTLNSDLHFARRKQVSSLYSAPVVSGPAYQEILKVFMSQFMAMIEEEASNSPSRVANGLAWVTWLTADIMIRLVYGNDHNIRLLADKESRATMAELIPKTNAADVIALEAIATLYPRIISRISGYFPPKSTMADFGLHQVEAALSRSAQKQGPVSLKYPSNTHLGRLVELYESKGPSAEIPNKRYIASDCLDHFIAGTRTTNDLLGAALWHLSLPENKGCQERLRSELHEAGVRPGTHPDLSSLQKLPYLNCVLKETLRTNPPIPIQLPRVVKDGETLTVMGFKIESGTNIASQSYSLHQDPNSYLEPETWKPERWEISPTSNEYRQMQRSFWPFGSGARMCTGMNVAWAMSRLVIARIFSTYSTSLDTIWLDENGVLLPPEKRKDFYPSLPNQPLRFEVCIDK